MPPRGQHGFTLVEVLVVILVVGLLAAIALPTFVGQRDKAEDASAKSDARNLVTIIQACFTAPESYGGCSNSTLETGGIRLAAPDGSEPGAGEASVIFSSQSAYEIHALSRSGVMYRIAGGVGLAIDRTCAPAGTGGCAVGGSW